MVRCIKPTHGLNIGLILGAALGGFVAIIIAAGILGYLRHRRNRRPSSSHADQQEDDIPAQAPVQVCINPNFEYHPTWADTWYFRMTKMHHRHPHLRSSLQDFPQGRPKQFPSLNYKTNWQNWDLRCITQMVLVLRHNIEDETLHILGCPRSGSGMQST